MLPKGRKNVEIFFSFFLSSFLSTERKSKKVDCQQFVAGDEIQFIFLVLAKNRNFCYSCFSSSASQATINEAKGCWVEFNWMNWLQSFSFSFLSFKTFRGYSFRNRFTWLKMRSQKEVEWKIFTDTHTLSHHLSLSLSCANQHARTHSHTRVQYLSLSFSGG